MSRPSIRALFIDLSGTLHIGSSPTPYSVDAFKRVREAGIPLRFCSNSSKESTAALRARLGKMGFDVRDGELWTSLGALKGVVRTRNLHNPLFLLSESAMEEFPEFRNKSSSLHTEHDSVIIGLSPTHLDYDMLTKAFRVLASNYDPNSRAQTQSRPPLVTTSRAKYVRTPDGELSLGPGPFVAALEDAVGGGLQAEVVGKPNREFFERVITSLSSEGEKLKYDEIAIIGDDIEADLGGAAVGLGLWRILVRTGKYRQGDEKREGQHPPDEVQDTFASFIDDLLSMA